jgi:hypothetical protein
MKKSLTYILILFAFKFAFGQTSKRPDKISTKDSIAVLEFWSKIVTALDNRDANTIKQNSVDTVDCFCGTDDSTQFLDKWPADNFSRQLILKYSNTKKLQKIIKTEKAQVNIRTDNPNTVGLIYYVSYVLDKPNEIAKGHEGTGIFFDFVKQNKTLKIYSVRTIP